MYNSFNILKQPEEFMNKIQLGEFKLGDPKTSGNRNFVYPQTSYLHHFLEPYEDLISKLITQLTNLPNENNYHISNALLDIIKDSSQADFVFILQNISQNSWVVKSQSNLSDIIDIDAYAANLKSTILQITSIESVFNPAHCGISKISESIKGVSKAFAIIPLRSQAPHEVMIVCGLTPDSYLLENIYSQILVSFYQAVERLSIQPVLVEAAIIDDLKKNFGFVSASLYERRLKLFCDRLKSMIVYFEPILHLDPEYLFISSWEALARNPESLVAPLDLFEAAELWGSLFTMKLDCHFLMVATTSYQQARKSKQRRPEDIVPLSVNVYPASLMEKEYFETVGEIIKDKIIAPKNLVLEISEKTELPKYHEGVYLNSPMAVFKNKLLEYVHQLKIRFAIDDFGVGYASVSRLAGLSPSYVKIDRDILHHPPSDVIIRFVHELVGANNLNPSNVIVEGVDETTPISLHRLKEIGVSYIQGHIVGKPEPEIYRLTQEKSEYLKKLILLPRN